MPITAALDNSELGNEQRRTGRFSDLVRITGSTGAAADTTTVVLPAGRRNSRILGGAFIVSSESVNLAGNTITIKAIVALGNDAASVEVLSDAV
jgi:hypothetical protein